jgi:ABC-2 type transport system permease protein
MSAAQSSVLPRRATIGDAIAAFFRRDLRVAISYKIPFFLEIVSIAFTVLAFVFVSKLVSPGRVPGGYFAFVLIGLTIAGFLTAGVQELGSNLRQEQVQGTLEALIASGVPIPGLAAGLAVYALVAAVWSAVVFLAVGGIAGARAEAGANWPLAMVALATGSVSFVAIGLVGAALVLLFRRAAAATGWLVAVLGLAGGELFPTSLLPPWFRTLAELSPYTWTLRVIRAGLLQSKGWVEAIPTLLVLASMAIVYGLVGLGALILGLRRARNTGSLGQY